MGGRRVIVNADDLGLAPGVNTAIFEVFRAGNLTSATLMVNMPGTLDAVERLSDHRGLAVGLHFCVTEGRALTGPSSITRPDGTFMTRGELLRRVQLGRIRSADITLELEAQLARMKELGVDPSHVDSHQHVHMAPGVFRAMLDILRQRALPVRTVSPPSAILRASWRRPSKLAKHLLNRWSAERRHGSALPTNHTLVSIHDLPDGRVPDSGSVYRELLEHCGDGVVELMVHPYRKDEVLQDMYSERPDAKAPFISKCLAEHRLLSGQRLFDGLQLITFKDL